LGPIDRGLLVRSGTNIGSCTDAIEPRVLDERAGTRDEEA
jgi:hypothetical protein